MLVFKRGNESERMVIKSTLKTNSITLCLVSVASNKCGSFFTSVCGRVLTPVSVTYLVTASLRAVEWCQIRTGFRAKSPLPVSCLQPADTSQKSLSHKLVTTMASAKLRWTYPV